MPSYPSCSIRGARGAGWQPEGEAGGPGPSETKQRPGRAPLIFPVQHPHARRTAILRFTACSARPRPPERGPTPSYGGAADGTAHSSRGTPDGPGSSLSVLRAVPVGAQWAGAPGHRARVRYLFSLHARLSAAARKGGPSSAHHRAVAGSPGHHHPLPVSPDPSIPPVASSLASQQRPGSSRAETAGDWCSLQRGTSDWAAGWVAGAVTRPPQPPHRPGPLGPRATGGCPLALTERERTRF